MPGKVSATSLLGSIHENLVLYDEMTSRNSIIKTLSLNFIEEDDEDAEDGEDASLDEDSSVKEHFTGQL